MPSADSSSAHSALASFPPERTWLIPALQAVQEAEGWLSLDSLDVVAEHFHVAKREVYDVATHYPAFRLTKPGNHVVRICSGVSCRLTGAMDYLHRLEDRLGIRCGETTLDGQVTLEQADCLFICSLAPVVEVDGACHGFVTANQAARLPIWFRRRQPFHPVEPFDFPLATAAGRTAQERLADLRSKAERRVRNRPEWRFLVQGSSCGQALGASGVVRALRILAAMRGLRAEILEAACHGMCYAGIVVEVQHSGWPSLTFTHLTTDAIPNFLSRLVKTEAPLHELEGVAWNEEGWRGLPPASRHPFFAGQHRLLMERCGHLNPVSLDEALLAGSYVVLAQVLDNHTPEEVIAEVKASGLPEGGGAYFAAAMKWEKCRTASREPKYFIMTGEEGEPGIFMDRHLMEGDPHRVLEGLLLAAYAAGTSRGILYINGEAHLSFDRMARALAEAQAVGVIGDHILGSTFCFHVEIRRGAGSFVLDDETMLLESIEGRLAMPRPRPPFPTESGLWGRPTVINNVETLAAVPAIMGRGGEWFARLGRGAFKGTKLFGLSGPLNRPGIVEVEMEVTLRQLIFELAGGLRNGKALKAAVVGGSSGAVVGPESLDTPLDPLGTFSPGTGGIVAVPEGESVADIEVILSLATTPRSPAGKVLSTGKVPLPASGAAARAETSGRQNDRYGDRRVDPSHPC